MQSDAISLIRDDVLAVADEAHFPPPSAHYEDGFLLRIQLFPR
jgi:hypothetical protein